MARRRCEDAKVALEECLRDSVNTLLPRFDRYGYLAATLKPETLTAARRADVLGELIDVFGTPVRSRGRTV